MSKKELLEKYRGKRHFDRTSEPFGSSTSKSARPIFVVQKHDASNLHYDFRIEVDGVLKSWAIPKGPSTDPREKRLAMPTEDHPLEYADFEGPIPSEEYGGGTVLVWDAGTYRNLKNKDGKEISVDDALSHGHIEIWLEGKKLRGGYAIVRTAKGKQEKWLLIKMKDDAADARRNPVNTEPDSVLTGRSLKEIAQEGNS